MEGVIKISVIIQYVGYRFCVNPMKVMKKFIFESILINGTVVFLLLVMRCGHAVGWPSDFQPDLCISKEGYYGKNTRTAGSIVWPRFVFR